MRGRAFLTVVLFLWSTLLSSVLLFLALQGTRRLFLRLDLETSETAKATGQVWWTARRMPFHPADSIPFAVAPGRHKVEIPLGVDIDTLQIRPAERPSDVVVHSIELATPYVSLHTWGGASGGFQGWRTVGPAERSSPEGGPLKLHVSGPLGGIQFDDVHPLRDEVRRNLQARKALTWGAAAGLVQTLVLMLIASLAIASDVRAKLARSLPPAPGS